MRLESCLTAESFALRPSPSRGMYCRQCVPILAVVQRMAMAVRRDLEDEVVIQARGIRTIGIPHFSLGVLESVGGILPNR